MPAYSRILLPWDSQPQESVEPASEFSDAYILWRGVGGGAIEFDASNYKNNAVVNGGTPYSIVGSDGRSIRFPNESTSMVSSRAVSVSGPFTVFAWISNAVTPSSGYYRLLETNYTTGLFLGVNSARTKWNFIVNNASLEGCISTSSLSSARTFVCGVFDGVNRNLYVNGILEASSSATSPNSSSLLYWSTIAGGSAGGIQGDQGNVGYFPRAFSAKLVKSLYDEPQQLFAPRSIWVPVSAGGGPTYTLAGDSGAFTLTGQDAGLAHNRVLAADSGSFALAGQDAALAFNRAMVAASGSFSLAGQDATLTYTPVSGATYTLTADSGAFTLAGQDAALIYGRVLVADSGAFALAGQDATLTYTPAALPTVGRPANDTSNAGWTASTGSDLYAMLDEVTPDAADYIVTTSTGSICEMPLQTTEYPGTAAQVLSYRASSSTGNSVIVRLKNTGGATVRSETQVLTSTDTLYEITLTAPEIAAITSGALSVELESA